MTQAEANQNAAAALGSIELGGRSFLVSQPTQQDTATLGKYLLGMAQNPLKAMAAELEGLPPELQKMAIDSAIKLKMSRANVPTTEEESKGILMAMLFTPEGCRFMAWILLRKEHPDVTLEMLKGLIHDGNYFDVLTTLTDQSGMASLGNSARPSGLS